MSTTTSDDGDDLLANALDRLLEGGAVEEAPDGTLRTTDAFEDVRRVYHDTYGHMDDDRFHRTVADLFDVSPEEAREYVETQGVTRDELVAYLAGRSFLKGAVDRQTLVAAARLLVEIGPGSPVPDAVEELDDESYEPFLAAHPDAVLSVWKHHCDPCRAMKRDMDAILDEIPDGVAVAGLDGEAVPAFRKTFDVTAAPALLLFRDGELCEQVTGRQSPERVAELTASVFDLD